MKVKNKNLKGVTLIEVVSVIAIISVFAVISYNNLADNRRHAEVEAAASEIASIINQTRSYALTGKKLDDGSVPSCFAIAYISSTNVWRRFNVNTDTCFGLNENSISISFADRNVDISNYSNPSEILQYRYSVPNGEIKNPPYDIEVISKANPSIKKKVIVSDYRAVVE